MSNSSRRQVLKAVCGGIVIGGATGVVGGRESNLKMKQFVFHGTQNAPDTCSESGQFEKIGRGATLPPGDVPYDIRTSVPPEWINDIKTSFSTWGNETGVINFVEQSGADSFVEYVKIEDIPRALGLARIFFTPTEIKRFEMQLNKLQPLETLDPNPNCFTDGKKFDVQEITTHEVGHAIGLGHAVAPRSTALTMYPFGWPGSTITRTLAQGDKNGVNALY